MTVEEIKTLCEENVPGTLGRSAVVVLLGKVEELEEECLTLRRLLVEAAEQLQIHDEEYRHVTRKGLKEEISKAIEGKKL